MSTHSGVLAQIARQSALEPGGQPFPPERTVAAELRRLYDLTGQLTRIPTEKDDTFRLSTTGGQFLVKIAPASESARIVNLQSAVMLHLESTAESLPTQRLIRGGERPGRVHRRRPRRQRPHPARTELPRGLPTRDRGADACPVRLSRCDVGPARPSLGGDFTHPADSRLLIWDLKNFSHMRPLLEWVTHPDDVTMATRIFDQFDALVAPPGSTTSTPR